MEPFSRDMENIPKTQPKLLCFGGIVEKPCYLPFKTRWNVSS